MNVNQDNRNSEAQNEQPGQMDSFNQRNTEESSATKDVKEKKDETESYTDYNGNSEANAPARARE